MSEQEPKYWLHRISWEWQVSYPLLKKGYLSIGFGGFGSRISLENLRVSFDNTMIDEWGELKPNRFCLKNFISGMKTGDYVAVPIYDHFNIYQITIVDVITAEEIVSKFNEEQHTELYDGDGNIITLNEDGYLVANNNIVDLGFFWKVRLIKQGISRYGFNRPNLSRTLGYPRTNLMLKGDIKEELKQIIR